MLTNKTSFPVLCFVYYINDSIESIKRVDLKENEFVFVFSEKPGTESRGRENMDLYEWRRAFRCTERCKIRNIYEAVILTRNVNYNINVHLKSNGVFVNFVTC